MKSNQNPISELWNLEIVRTQDQKLWRMENGVLAPICSQQRFREPWNHGAEVDTAAYSWELWRPAKLESTRADMTPMGLWKLESVPGLG